MTIEIRMTKRGTEYCSPKPGVSRENAGERGLWPEKQAALASEVM